MFSKMKTQTLFVVALLVVAFSFGCSFEETAKANKLIDVANTSVKDANDKIDKGTDKLVGMEKAVSQMEDENDLEKTRTMAKDIISDLEKARDGYKDAGNKFDEASKLKVKDKFKEYLDLKAKEMKKRSDLADAMIGEPKALIESSNHDEYQKKVQAVVAKVTD